MNTINRLSIFVTVLALGLAVAAPAQAAHLEMFDNGARTQMVAVGSSSVYILKESGAIFEYRWGEFNKIFRGRGISQIVADGNKLYARGDDGQVLEYDGYRFSRIDGGRRARMLATGHGKLYMLRDDGTVYKNSWSGWDRIDSRRGVKHISATRDGLLATKHNGNIWQYNDWSDRWSELDPGSNTQMAVGNGTENFVLKNSGNIYMERRGNWRKIDPGTGTKQIEVDGNRLYIVKGSGRVFAYLIDRDDFVPVMEDAGARNVSAAGGELYIVMEDRGIYKLEGRLYGGRDNRRSDNFDRLHR